mgnify:CR=1 FL=1
MCSTSTAAIPQLPEVLHRATTLAMPPLLLSLLPLLLFSCVFPRHGVAAPPLLLLPQKVFVVGMFKTGTTSLTSALRKLGGNCGGGTTSGLTTCGFNPRMLPLDTDWLEPDLLDRLQKSPFYDDVLRLQRRRQDHFVRRRSFPFLVPRTGPPSPRI